MLKVLTGPSVNTHVSLLPPPRCIDTIIVSEEALTRLRPPGIMTYESS